MPPLDETLYFAELGAPKINTNEQLIAQFSPEPKYEFNQYTFSLLNEPENVHINNKGKVIWEPIENQVGKYEFTVSISDGITETTKKIEVFINSPPIISRKPSKVTIIKEKELFKHSFKSYDQNKINKFKWEIKKGF